MQSIFEFVQQQRNNYRTETIEITPSYDYSQYNKLSFTKDPLGLAGRSFYLPDISPEELERRIEADTRKAILDEELAQARRTRLLR